MSSPEVDLISRIVGEYYGDIVQGVSRCAAKSGPIHFRDILKHTGLPVNQVKMALSVLIQHNMLTFHMPSRDKYAISTPVNYIINYASVLARLRYPSYIYFVERAYGYEAEIIVEEILKHGQIDTSTLLVSVYKRLEEASQGKPMFSISDVYNKLVTLASNHLICRCPSASVLQHDVCTSDTAASKSSTKHVYDVPKIDIPELTARKRKISSESVDMCPPAKRARLDESVDEQVYWQINIDKFHDSIRDRIVVDVVRRKFDKPTSEIVRTMLKFIESHDLPHYESISITNILRSLPCELKLSKEVVEQYLKILCDSSGKFIRRSDDSSGGMYQIVFERVFSELCSLHVESVIEERFGSQSHRIFRLLLLKERLDEKQILAETMTSDKSLLRRLHDEKFVSLTVVPPPGEYNPQKTLFLFSVDLNTVAQMTLQLSYKSLFNLMSRRQSLAKEHEGLVKEEQRLEYILHSIDPADEASREEYIAQISPSDRDQLRKFKQMMNKLEVAELQLDDTIFILETYLGHMKTMWKENADKQRVRSR